MRIKTNFQAVALTIKKNEGREGRNYYQVSFDQEGECGTLPLTEDAYNSIAASFKRYTPASFIAEFSDQYKTFRITGISQGRI